MKSNTMILLVLGILTLAALLLFRGGGETITTLDSEGSSNVAIVDGQQIVTIKAKGGYQPQTSVVQAGVPTVLRFVTSGSFDCSSAVLIPDLGISINLPSSGTTDVDVGTLSAGTLQGMCSMGMYRFDVIVQES